MQQNMTTFLRQLVMASVYTSGKSEHSVENPPGMPACMVESAMAVFECPSGLGQSSVCETGVLVGSLSASGTSSLNRCICWRKEHQQYH